MIGGWTVSIITFRKRLGDGNSPRGTEKERQIQEAEKGNQGPLGSGLCGVLGARTGQPQPYPHSGPECHHPPPMPSPNRGPSPSSLRVSCPRTTDCTGHNSWRPMLLALEPLEPRSRLSQQERRLISTQFLLLLAIKPGICLSSKSPTNKDHPASLCFNQALSGSSPEI